MANDEPTRVYWDIPDAGGTRRIAGLDFGGAGRPILLHHANGFCAGTWALVARRLTPHYRVYAMDARGHGDSAPCRVPEAAEWSCFVEDVANVARAIAATHGEARLAIGVGSSFGGVVTATAEGVHGGLFERIVMLDPPIHPTAEICAAVGLPAPADDAGRRDQLVEMTLRRRTEWPSREALRASWEGKAMFADWLPEAFDLYLEWGFADTADGGVRLKCDPAVEAHIFATTGALSPVQFAPRIEVPVRLVRATRGHFSGEFFAALIRLFSQGSYAELEGGHLLPMEVPHRCVEQILT